MKNLVLVFFILCSFTTSADDCATYSKKAVACYELGKLGKNYDETGEECGLTYSQSFWTVDQSLNPTIASETYDYREYGYMGGHAWESKCYVHFTDLKTGKDCFIDMLLSLGTEDASVKIFDFSCK